MADTPAAGDPIQPTGGGPAGSHDVEVIPPAPRRRRFMLRSVPPGIAAGLPIVDVPLLVEPIALADTPAEAPPRPASQRPMRRSFLPPLSTPGPDAPGRSPAARDLRPRMPASPPLVALPAEPGERLASAPEPLGRLGRASRQVDTASVPATPRRWRRRLLVGVGITAALAFAVAVEIGVNFASLSRLGGVVWQRLTGSPTLSSAAAPPADPAHRVAYYADRAKAGDSEAQLALAILYAKGEGVAQDYAVAATWFRSAAERGVARAQYDLGVLYERGRGVPFDHTQAVAWYRKAAEQNHPLAQYNLAVAFTKGEGVRRDLFEAAVWYHRAASQGVVAAMVNLAILYEAGDGVDASAINAYAWYRAAARRGSVAASRRADELLPAFSPWDQTRAEAKMADIAASIRDPIGERSRLAAKGAPAAPQAAPEAAPQAAPGPALKSGIESGRNSPRGIDIGAESP